LFLRKTHVSTLCVTLWIDLGNLNVGDEVRVTPQPISGMKERFSISYENTLEDLDEDDTIFINDESSSWQW